MLLYQVATAGLSPGDIASPIRWILRRQRNVDVLLGEARARRHRRRGDSAATSATLQLRLSDRRHRLDARLLRPRRMAGARARPQDAGRCAGDPGEGAAGVRAGRAQRRRPTSAGGCSRSSSSAAARPAWSWPARSPRSRATRCATSSVASIRRDDDRPAARRRPAVLPSFPPELQTRAQWDLQRLGVTVRTRRHRHAASKTGRSTSATSGSKRARCCGPPASPPRRSGARSACRSIASGA